MNPTRSMICHLPAVAAVGRATTVTIDAIIVGIDAIAIESIKSAHVVPKNANDDVDGGIGIRD